MSHAINVQNLCDVQLLEARRKVLGRMKKIVAFLMILVLQVIVQIAMRIMIEKDEIEMRITKEIDQEIVIVAEGVEELVVHDIEAVMNVNSNPSMKKDEKKDEMNGEKKDEMNEEKKDERNEGKMIEIVTVITIIVEK